MKIDYLPSGIYFIVILSPSGQIVDLVNFTDIIHIMQNALGIDIND